MATKKSDQAGNMGADLAKKLSELAPVAPEIHYYRPETDAGPVSIVGVLVERRTYKRKDGSEGANFVFVTTIPTMLFARDEEDPSLQPAGSFALVTEWKVLEELRRYLPIVGPNGFESVCEVAVIPKKPKKLRNGGTMKDFEIRARRLEAARSPVELPAAPTAPSVALLSASSESESEEIPF